ncbi:hypothetical protein ACRB8A_14360 [Arthrobacter sp. G.S.26]|uniref:hypothetical protein n=1 Tax=Arthrobacter sp. G.S.26 TaxID=3433706 RepID=UPI003D781720
MINAQLTNLVIASLKAAGVTPPELTPTRPFPRPTKVSAEELIEAVIASKHDDPYQDPAVIAIASKHYVQSLGTLEQGHVQIELARRAAELNSNKDLILGRLQKAFKETAEQLVEDAAPIKQVDDPAAIDPRSSSREASLAAGNVIHGIRKLEAILKAWADLWLALGKASYGVERGKPFAFMNPNAEMWDQLRLNPTIWEAVHMGEPLTLADSPEHVSERFQAMIRNEQAAFDSLREAHHSKNGAALLKAFRG